MYEQMASSENWVALGLAGASNPADVFQRAQRLANEGKFAVVGFLNMDGPGHVAVVVPDDGAALHRSPSWGNVQVPFIAQAGTTVFSKGSLSAAFDPARNSKVQKTTEIVVLTSRQR